MCFKLCIFYINKAVEIINLPKILWSKNDVSKILSGMSKDDAFMVTCKLDQPIRSKLRPEHVCRIFQY